MRHRRLSFGLCLGALAFGGLIAGHFLGYAVVASDPHVRADLLAATGHGSHGVVATAGIAAAIAGLIALVAAQVRPSGARGPKDLRLARVGATLWVLQSMGFVVLEAVERGGLAHALAHLPHEPAFWLGLAAQALVALVATAVVWLLRFTVHTLLRILARPSAGQAQPVYPSSASTHVPVGIARRAWNLRGPPRVSALIR